MYPVIFVSVDIFVLNSQDIYVSIYQFVITSKITHIPNHTTVINNTSSKKGFLICQKLAQTNFSISTILMNDKNLNLMINNTNTIVSIMINHTKL